MIGIKSLTDNANKYNLGIRVWSNKRYSRDILLMIHFIYL